MRMRASAGRERIAAGTLTTSYVPGELQVADVGTKPLPGPKLMGLLGLVNVRLPPSAGVPPAAAKFLCRLGSVSTAQAEKISPALVMFLTVLSGASQVEAFKEGPRSWVVLAAVQGFCLVEAQPVDWLDVSVGWLRWALCVLGGIIAVVALLWFSLCRSKPERTGLVNAAANQSIERDEALQPSSDGGALLQPSRVGEEEPTLGGADERCRFPMVGRVDRRSNWVPAHFLRWILSLVGGRLLGCLGLDTPEVWRLRAMARTFRYGVAFAYEKARGLGPLRNRGGTGLVYDIAQAAIQAGSSEGQVIHAGSSEGQAIQAGSSEGQAIHAGSSEGQAIQAGSSEGQAIHAGSSEGQAIQAGSSEGPSVSADGGEEDQSSGLGSQGASELSSLSRSSATTTTTDFSDDPGIDEVRHIPHDHLQVGGPMEVVRQVFNVPVESETGESTSSRASVEDLGTASEATAVQGSPIRSLSRSSVAYRAVDGGLFVVYADDELFVPLEGWSLEEVGSIVESIRSGDWSLFHEVMALGSSNVSCCVGPIADGNHDLPEGTVAYGSTDEQPQGAEESSESESLPDLEPLHPEQGDWVPEGATMAIWFGALAVLTLGSISLADWCLNGPPRFVSADFRGESRVCQLTNGVTGVSVGGEVYWGWVTFGLVFAWVFSCWHRFWFVVVGLDSRTGVSVIDLPGGFIRAEVPCFRLGWSMWVLLLILFGMCGFSEGEELSESRQVVAWVDPVCREPEIPEDGPAGWGVFVSVGVVAIIIWETLRKLMCRQRVRSRTVESQTEGTQWVPLPLASGVPNRSNILFSLWLAGYQLDVDSYPEDVREEYFGYIGGYLGRQSRDELDSE